VSAILNPPPQSLSDCDLKYAIRELSIVPLLSGKDEKRLDALKSELERRRSKRRGKEGA
jgi:hypothetical protein